MPQSPGCFGKLLRLWVFLFMAGLITAMAYVAKPQPLDDIGGYGRTAAEGESRDLKAVLEASLHHGHPLALSEAEINRWLGRTLKTRQGGMLAKHVSLDRVWIRLNQGIAEIIMERRIMGRPCTLSMFVIIEQTRGKRGIRTVINRHGGRYLDNLPAPLRGGRFGSLVVPQGFLNLVVASFGGVAALYDEEIKLALESMAVIRIDDDRLVLEPHAKADPSMAPPSDTF
jgi:hypothetical protein